MSVLSYASHCSIRPGTYTHNFIVAHRKYPTEDTSNKYKTKTGRSSSRRSGDRIELLSDQDVVEYDPNSDYDEMPTRSKPSSGIFNDV